MQRNSPDHLQELLRQRNREPDQAARIDLEIQKIFRAERAIYVSDMSGFSRIVAQYGIIHFLAMIQQMRDISLPVVEVNHGELVKTEGDNIMAVFECVEDALRTAREVRRQTLELDRKLPPDRQLHLSIGIGFGRILLMDRHDLYGDEMNLASKLGEDIAAGDEVLLTAAAQRALVPGVVRLEERRASVSGLELVHYAVLG
ncbi:MAG: adenylate/guanylate cyclase domain-containing protein [Acidobacteria bacterium]|nr:adenylate/guanylate cyclase domain-containing protein [Acidobacteriota bacterium]